MNVQNIILFSLIKWRKFDVHKTFRRVLGVLWTSYIRWITFFAQEECFTSVDIYIKNNRYLFWNSRFDKNDFNISLLLWLDTIHLFISITIFPVLTLYKPTQQNDNSSSNILVPIVDELFECVWPFLGLTLEGLMLLFSWKCILLVRFS